MDKPQDPEAAETDQTTNVPAVDLPRLVLGSSDTPETDAATHLMQHAPNQWLAVVDAEFSEKLEREKSRLSALYHELLLSVESVYQGETRHETALRYIRERETFSCAPASDSSERHSAGAGWAANNSMKTKKTTPAQPVDLPRLVRHWPHARADWFAATLNWRHTSRRKTALIEKKIRRTATEKELTELNRLKWLTEERAEYFAPLAPLETPNDTAQLRAANDAPITESATGALAAAPLFGVGRTRKDIMKTQIEIVAGSGGKESADFASLLAEMYEKWGALNDVRIERFASEFSIVLLLEGNRLDRLHKETGVHRLVRISPHDKQSRRHTSFVSVCVGGEKLDKQVRSYVLNPYTKVKNLLTGEESADVHSVLNGKIDLLWETPND